MKRTVSRFILPLVILLSWTPAGAAEKPAPASGGVREDPSLPAMNQLVLRAIKVVPNGGGYQTSKQALENLKLGVVANATGNGLVVRPEVAKPSFCSGATYLVFTRVLSALGQAGQVKFQPQAWQALAQFGQPDGDGVWGRWNANGPGTAKLFADLGCGSNFTEYARALPGDFMKIWWTDGIGSTESGHSVVYLGQRVENGQRTVLFWSSNIPGGYGEKSVPETKIKRVLFSRLEKPERVAGITRLGKTDPFLAAMVKRPATWEEVARECKVPAPRR